MSEWCVGGVGKYSLCGSEWGDAAVGWVRTLKHLDFASGGDETNADQLIGSIQSNQSHLYIYTYTFTDLTFTMQLTYISLVIHLILAKTIKGGVVAVFFLLFCLSTLTQRLAASDSSSPAPPKTPALSPHPKL